MRKPFQINFQINIFLTLIFGVSLSISENQNQHHLKPNSSFHKANVHLLKPIIIPELKQLREDSGHSNTSQPNPTKKDTNNKTNDLFVRELLDQEEQRVSRESEEVSTFKESPKFSSRYSSQLEINDLDELEDKNELEEKNDDIVEKENITETPEAGDSLERSENERMLFKIIEDVVSENEKHSEYPDHSNESYTSHLEDEEEHQTDVHSEINHSREGEESGDKSSTSEPYLESEISFDEHAEEEVDDKPSSHHQEDEKEDDKRSAGDYLHSSKNHHSVQTPLNEIRFRGPHTPKDDFDKSRTRLVAPMNRAPVSYNWPYFKARVKAEPVKFNEITDDHGHDKEDSEEWKSEIFKTKQAELEKAAEKDESRRTASKKHNYLTDRKKQTRNGLAREEKKDQESPVFLRIKQYKTGGGDRRHEPQPFVEKPKQKLFSNPVTVNYEKFFSDKSSIKGTDFNVSQELGTNSHNHRFRKPTTPNTKQKNFSQKLYSKAHHPQGVRKSFLKDLEDRETYDGENLENEKMLKQISGNDVSIPSFNYLEESEELYNQILANIQSVFGLRTQPLKSAASRKSNAGLRPELKLEENRSLTWSLLGKKSNENKPQKPPLKRSEKVKTGSEETTTLKTPAFPTDILKL